jgi:hypothetical protein
MSEGRRRVNNPKMVMRLMSDAQYTARRGLLLIHCVASRKVGAIVIMHKSAKFRLPKIPDILNLMPLAARDFLANKLGCILFYGVEGHLSQYCVDR